MSSWNYLGRVSLIEPAFCSGYEMCTKIKLDFFQICKTMESNNFRLDNSLSTRLWVNLSFKCENVEQSNTLHAWRNVIEWGNRFCQPATKRKEKKRTERLHRQIFLFRDFEIFVNLTQHLGPTYKGDLGERKLLEFLASHRFRQTQSHFLNIKIKASSNFNYN